MGNSPCICDTFRIRVEDNVRHKASSTSDADVVPRIRLAGHSSLCDLNEGSKAHEAARQEHRRHPFQLVLKSETRSSKKLLRL